MTAFRLRAPPSLRFSQEGIGPRTPCRTPALASSTIPELWALCLRRSQFIRLFPGSVSVRSSDGETAPGGTVSDSVSVRRGWSRLGPSVKPGSVAHQLPIQMSVFHLQCRVPVKTKEGVEPETRSRIPGTKRIPKNSLFRGPFRSPSSLRWMAYSSRFPSPPCTLCHV